MTRSPLAGPFALRSNVTVYVYLALVEALEVPLLIGDSALQDVPGCRAVAEIVTASA